MSVIQRGWNNCLNHPAYTSAVILLPAKAHSYRPCWELSQKFKRQLHNPRIRHIGFPFATVSDRWATSFEIPNGENHGSTRNFRNYSAEEEFLQVACAVGQYSMRRLRGHADILLQPYPEKWRKLDKMRGWLFSREILHQEPTPACPVYQGYFEYNLNCRGDAFHYALCFRHRLR